MTSLRRAVRHLTGGVTALAVTLLGAPVVLASVEPARTAHVSPLSLVGASSHPHRKIKKYVVRRGDTPSEIATRYHAWTDELIAMNGRVLHVGEVIKIPVVLKRARACKKHRDHFTGYYGHQHDKGKTKDKPKSKKPKDRPKEKKPKHHKPTKHKKPGHHAHHHPKHGWVHAHASHREVRRIVAKRARYHDVNPDLALAVSWMESGWQQKRISSAGALGAMQVMPATGVWMSQVVGRTLNLRNLHDNVTAGVVLLKLLRQQAGPRHAVAGYYQGLAGVRKYGMYRSTKRYVANVMALKRRLATGWDPL
jgi:hypothetical protein